MAYALLIWLIASCAFGGTIRIATYGDSRVEGYVPNVGCCLEGWRTDAVGLYAGRGITASFVGAKTYGGNPATYTDADSGKKPIDVLNKLASTLATNFPSPTSNDWVLIGPQIVNCVGDTDTATFRAQVDAQINSVNAHSPLINLVMFTDIANTLGINVVPYNAEVRDAVTAARAAGKNVRLADIWDVTVEMGDGVHPTVAGYLAMANFQVDFIAPLVATPGGGMKRTLFLRLD